MIPQGTRVYFAREAADMRKSFDGLAALAASTLAKDPSAGGLFVFVNKRGTQARILFRDDHGWCLLSKRLDHGRFRRPRIEGERVCWETDARSLMLFLEEIDLAPAGASRAPSKSSSKAGRSHLQVVQP